MTGSGSGCFGFFPDPDEAADAASSVEDLSRAAVGATAAARGVVSR